MSRVDRATWALAGLLSLCGALAPRAAAAAGEPPRVRYVVKLASSAWEPIALAELEPMLEARVLAPLTKPGVMRLEKSGWAELGKGDYALTIEGRFIEDAGDFSVYVGFGKGQKDDLPSLHVAETVAVDKLSRAQVEQRIQEGATRAAERMARLLAPRLEAVRLSVPPPITDEPVTTTWGDVEIPEARSPTKVMQDLLDVTKPDHVRHEALTALASHAFDQPAVRDVLVRSMLLDPTPGIRARAAEALAPVARTHVPTQRLILLAMRREVSDEVLGELVKLSRSFPGLSRKETLETWLEMVSSETTPPSAASALAQLLAAEDQVPNLDLAVARCLDQQALIYGKRSACAQWLLDKVPPARRYSVTARYLSRVQVWETGENNVFEDVIDALTQNKNASTKLSPEVAEAMFTLLERKSAGRARRQAIVQLARHPAPTPALVERLLGAVHERELVSMIVRALYEWVDDHPELADMSVGALQRVRASAQYLVKPSHGNPYEELDEGAKRIQQLAARKKR